MLIKLQPFRLTREQEDSYRQFYLQADVKQAIIGLLLYVIPLFGFIVNDYQFLGLSTEFGVLAALRFCLLFFTVFVLIYLGKVKSYRSYDKMMSASVLFLLLVGGIINATRPQNFITHAIIVIVAVFVLYLVIPNRFINQILFSATATIGEIAIILLASQTSDGTALFTVIFSMCFANIIAFSGSWQLHSYRRRSFQDITKRKELQESLEQHTKHLEELVTERTEKLKSSEQLAAIGATAGMVGHDIRNPLTAITGAVYLAKKDLTQLPDSEAKERLKKNLDLIGDETVYVNKIVADLQDYARPLKPELKEVDLEQTIHLASSGLETSRGLTIEYQIEANFPKIRTDPSYMQRILRNLFNNAVQAMPNGGKLAIKVTFKDGKAFISVEDTGEGIPEEVRGKLFKPLITTKAKGQGFGLAVVKRLTEALGGTVLVESEVGKGTKFTVELPLSM
jgi:signal transduction histidine kinase